MAQQPQRPAGPIYTYVDLPEISETFADSIYGVLFDGQTLRITFAVNRMDPPQPPNPTTGKCYPACRLVLTPSAAAELSQQLNQIGAAMARAQAESQAGGPGRKN
jgi:hypothetical protein